MMDCAKTIAFFIVGLFIGWNLMAILEKRK